MSDDDRMTLDELKRAMHEGRAIVADFVEIRARVFDLVKLLSDARERDEVIAGGFRSTQAAERLLADAGALVGYLQLMLDENERLVAYLLGLMEAETISRAELEFLMGLRPASARPAEHPQLGLPGGSSGAIPEHLVQLWLHSEEDPSDIDWGAWLPNTVRLRQVEVRTFPWRGVEHAITWWITRRLTLEEWNDLDTAENEVLTRIVGAEHFAGTAGPVPGDESNRGGNRPRRQVDDR